MLVERAADLACSNDANLHKFAFRSRWIAAMWDFDVSPASAGTWLTPAADSVQKSQSTSNSPPETSSTVPVT